MRESASGSLDKYFQIIDDLSSKKEVKIVHDANIHTQPQAEQKREEESEEILALTFKEDTAYASVKASATIDSDDLLPLEFK